LSSIGDESIIESVYKLGLEESDYSAVAKDRGLLTRGEWLGSDMGYVGSRDGLYLTPTNDSITIRRGQFWSTPGCRERGCVLEILGFTDGEVDVATWDCLHNAAVGVGCMLQASSGLAGSRSQVPITHDLLGADSELVHVTGDKYSRKGRRVVKVRATEGRAPQLPVTKYDVEVPKALSDLVDRASGIYTDGSWKDSSSLLERATDVVRRVEVGAGLVAYRANEPPRAVRITSTRGCEYDSAYSVELLALTAAIVARGCAGDQLSISSDCQSAIRTCLGASRGQAKAVARTSDGYTKGLRGFKALCVRKVKAHPERRNGNRATWSQDDRGIYAADRVADNSPDAINFVTIEDNEVLDWLARLGPVSLRKRGVVLTRDVSKMEQERVTKGYLLRQDEYRAVLRAERVAAGESGDTKRPRWVGTTVQLPGRIAKAAAVGTGQACRLVFDKRWIGSNNMKDGRSSGICALCGKCVEDQEHIMLRCDDRRMVARRSELMTDIHAHVGRVIHRGGPGAAALETIAGIARDHVEGYSVYTGLFTPDIVSTLRLSHEWTRASDGRSFAGLIKGMAPFLALLSGMMMKRDECTADDKAGTGQHYTDGWGQRRGMQHKKTVGAANIMCMASWKSGNYWIACIFAIFWRLNGLSPQGSRKRRRRARE
jgi:hypothetical protein